MKYFFPILSLFLGSFCLAESFGILPLPAFNVKVPYPQGWKNEINMGPGYSFINITFTPNGVANESETAKPTPTITFTSARLTMATLGMAGMAGAARGVKNLPNVPGIGGRWSQANKEEPKKTTPPPTAPTPEGGAKGPEPAPAIPNTPRNKSIIWLGQKADIVDSTHTDEEGQTTKSRSISILLPDKSVMMSCSAPQESFTPEFSKMCDQIIKNVKRIR